MERISSNRMLLFGWLLCACAVRITHCETDEMPDIYACDSRVYCQGPLLDAVQRSAMFDDSKTFVDMPMKFDEEVVLAKFEQLYSSHPEGIPFQSLHTFVHENFDKEGQELEQATLTDWVARPYVFYKIRDVDLRFWANELNILWKKLARKIKSSEQNNNRSSLIYVPNTFIIPGGRFREFYYWDSYWIIKGLLVSEMEETVRGMLENLLSLVERYGFIPNGGRIYYTRRTQPPFLIPMVESYFDKTEDVKFLKKHIDTLEKEYKFWLHHRTVIVNVKKNGESYGLARYRADSNMPRPEGYRDDVQLAEQLSNTNDVDTCDVTATMDCRVEQARHSSSHDLFTNIASACESGWDFSTRWFRDRMHLSNIITQDIIPVDLNSILCANERILSKLYAAIGDSGKASLYERSYEIRRKGIHDVMWNERLGIWYDYSMAEGEQRVAYFISNFLPLFAQCYDNDEQIPRVLNYIKHTELASFPGGVPNSLTRHAAEQWDYPNAWPPNVHMLIEGLANTGDEDAYKVALNMTQTWISSNYKAYKDHGAMFEKYNVEASGAGGGGGEYDVQVGFGWTNGVILALLDRFGNEVKAVSGRDLLFGLTLEAFVCIVTVLIILGLIATGTIVYLKKKYELKKRRGLSSVDDVQYAPVNTSVVSSNDNQKDNRENELKEEF